ncbi:MAG: HAMP domain-containing histidine kinase [Acidimicrobiia bacterium]|nr:HAMP domain-containing histidine kinase [Acidimicrobiia bacterium]
MKAMAWAVAVVLVGGVLLAELVMDLNGPDRRRLYALFGVAALGTFLAALGALRALSRARSLLTSLRIVALAAVAVTAAVVAGSSVGMFIDRHDLSLVLVALLLGVGLGGVLAVGLAGSLTGDLAAVSRTARAVADGDFSVRTGIDRRDELGRAGRAFDEMVQRLEASEEERKQLLAAISHDLRTPLSSMQAAVEALQDDVAPDPAAYLRGMGHDLAHLGRLVDDLFMLARIDAGRLELAPTQVDLAELADEAVEAVTPTAAVRGVRLSVDAPGRIEVMADPAALGRVFRNLLANAVRHSPDSGEVTVLVARTDQQVETVVSDEGAGFTDEIRPVAFDRFVRADGSRSRESGGSGLGLAIAKGIIDAHGGSIAIGDGPGGRVRFLLPANGATRRSPATKR